MVSNPQRPVTRRSFLQESEGRRCTGSTRIRRQTAALSTPAGQPMRRGSASRGPTSRSLVWASEGDAELGLLVVQEFALQES